MDTVVTVQFSYIILNTSSVGKSLKTFETYGDFTTDLPNFKKWCRRYLLGLKPDGKPPKYMLGDVYALTCKFSDGREFIWQQHCIDYYGNKRGGWQKVK